MSRSFTLYYPDGSPIEVIETQPESSWGDSDGGGRSRGRRTLTTPDNRIVEFAEPGVFEIVDDDGKRTRLTDKPSA